MKRTSEKYEFPKEAFYNELKRCRELNIEPCDFVGQELLRLAQVYLNKPNFRRYSEDVKDEMISYAMYRCVGGLNNYDLNRPDKICSYFLRIIHFAFVEVIMKYYRRLNGEKNYVRQHLKDIGKTDDEIQKMMGERFGDEDDGYNVIPKDFTRATERVRKLKQQTT